MARLRGVRASGAGIEIRYQLDGRRRSVFINKTPTAANLADAARYRKRLIEQEAIGEPETRNATFATCCQGFIADKAKSLKLSTLHGYKSKLEVYWSELSPQPIRAIRLVELKRIDRNIDWQSQKTRRDAHAVLRGVFEWAIAEDLAAENPARRLTVGAWQRPEIDAFSDAERVAIMRTLHAQFRVFYGLMFETGMRTGELQALRWDDVRGDHLAVKASMYRGKVVTTKTHQARTVLLTKAAQELLKHHTESRFRGGFVFMSSQGGPYAVDRSLSYVFKRACQSAGVRYRRPYYCRHTFATRALMRGVEPSFLAQQMGDRLETVMRHYAQWISGDRDRREIDKLNGDNVGIRKAKGP
jgi:integrase